MKEEIISRLSGRIDKDLLNDLITSWELVKLEYRKGIWSRTLAESGRFVENVFRVLEFIRSGNKLEEIKDLEDIKFKLEQTPNKKLSESIRILIPRIAISLIYSLRSKKDAIHVKPIKPDQIDATLAISGCDWIIAELLRNYGIGNTAEIIDLIQRVIKKEIPLIQNFNGEKLVTRKVDCRTEILIHLLDTKEGLTRNNIGKLLKLRPASTITVNLKSLESDRYIFFKGNGKYVITEAGELELFESLSKK